jgi:fucose permease
MAPIFPTGVTLAGESIHLTARITGLIFLGDSLGGMVLPGILGKVIEITSPRSLMVLVFSSLLMTSITFFFILRQRKRII